jgi:hypothetical protein
VVCEAVFVGLTVTYRLLDDTRLHVGVGGEFPIRAVSRSLYLYPIFPLQNEITYGGELTTFDEVAMLVVSLDLSRRAQSLSVSYFKHENGRYALECQPPELAFVRSTLLIMMEMWKNHYCDYCFKSFMQ